MRGYLSRQRLLHDFWRLPVGIRQAEAGVGLRVYLLLHRYCQQRTAVRGLDSPAAAEGRRMAKLRPSSLPLPRPTQRDLRIAKLEIPPAIPAAVLLTGLLDNRTSHILPRPQQHLHLHLPMRILHRHP